MEIIIQQITLELVKNITNLIAAGGIKDLDQLATDALALCKQSAKDIVQTALTQMNLDIRNDKAARKKQGLVLKEKDRPRTLLTDIGSIQWKRDYYYDKKSAAYAAVLDKMIGVRQYERIGDNLQAELINQAADVSYAKSCAIVSDVGISRQTVRNILTKLTVPEIPLDGEVRGVKELHIYADEDHVHMQKPNKQRGKQNRIVPLVVVTEGTEFCGERRNRTVNAKYFVSENFKPTEIWKDVEGYIDKVYDMQKLEKIYVHGDGGNWIQNGLDIFYQTKHVMDGYHFRKHLRTVACACSNHNVTTVIRCALHNNNAKGVAEYLRALAQEMPGTKCIMEFENYLIKHWGPIRRREVLNIPGSCTEGQISHILSKRFSRNPMGWSDKCLGKLSKIRVYHANGRRIMAQDFKPKAQSESYSAYADKVINAAVQGAFDWSMFSPEPLIFDGASGTQTLIHALSR